MVSEDIDPESHDTEKDQKDQSDQRGDELGGSVGCRFGWLRNSKEIDKGGREEKERFHKVQGIRADDPKVDGSSFPWPKRCIQNPAATSNGWMFRRDGSRGLPL